MMWEYLDKEELDARFLVAAGYIGKNIEGKNILDLNCGQARLTLYLPKIYKNYYCNDINTVPICIDSPIDFQQKNDREMVQYLKEKSLNILCVFGHGGGDKLNNIHESQSLSQSAIALIESHRPEIIILEANLNYVKKHAVLKEIIDKATTDLGYNIKHNIIIKPDNSSDTLSERNIKILQRKDTEK